jgi:hypothetical protein
MHALRGRMKLPPWKKTHSSGVEVAGKTEHGARESAQRLELIIPSDGLQQIFCADSRWACSVQRKDVGWTAANNVFFWNEAKSDRGTHDFKPAGYTRRVTPDIR